MNKYFHLSFKKNCPHKRDPVRYGGKIKVREHSCKINPKLEKRMKLSLVKKEREQ